MMRKEKKDRGRPQKGNERDDGEGDGGGHPHTGEYSYGANQRSWQLNRNWKCQPLQKFLIHTYK